MERSETSLDLMLMWSPRREPLSPVRLRLACGQLSTYSPIGRDQNGTWVGEILIPFK